MTFYKILGIVLVFSLFVSFFSQLHREGGSNNYLSKLRTEVSDSLILDVSCEAEALYLHVCHVGHIGCFFNIPTVFSFFYGFKALAIFKFSSEIHYSGPYQQAIERPPIF